VTQQALPTDSEAKLWRLVFVPGLPGDARTFAGLVSRLPKDMDVSVVEQPELDGCSDVDAWLREADRRIRAAVTGAVGSRVLLVGLSLGGYFAARWLSRDEPGVEGAVLVGAFASIPADMATGRRTLAEQLEAGTLSMTELETMVDATCGEPEERDAATDEIVRYSIGLLSKAGWIRALRYTARLEEAAYAVAAFSVPTTIIHARGDGAVPLAAAEQLARLGSNVDLQVVEGTSHVLPLTQPALVLDAILQQTSSAPRSTK
jgi:pimeloyl-ACP methyl ester carboxylesterase